MEKVKALVVLLIVAVLVESTVIVYPLVKSGNQNGSLHLVGSPTSQSFGYQLFDQPIANDTESRLTQNYTGSWQMVIRSNLQFDVVSQKTESQVALAPVYADEALSIPTIIVQERSDGLIRVEYFAQNWPGTYGLILYNSTSPGWTGSSVTLVFASFGPPSAVNPQIAPRPNGNLTVLVGSNTVVSSYPIAWAPLGDLYLYGLQGSKFTRGSLSVSIQAMARG